MMLKLIRLEWKKHTVWKYIRSAVFMTAAIIGILILMSISPGTAKIIPPTGRSLIQSSVEIFLNMSYLIFTGVMLSSFIVSEYENKQINLMFSYPIKRKKVLLAKVLSVCIFNLIALLLSKGITYAVLMMVHFQSAESIDIKSVSFLSSTLLWATISVCGGCIVLLPGMKTKSSKTTIILSFVLMIVVLGVLQGNVVPFTSLLGAVGYAVEFVLALVAVLLSVNDVETEDIM